MRCHSLSRAARLRGTRVLRGGGSGRARAQRFHVDGRKASREPFRWLPLCLSCVFGRPGAHRRSVSSTSGPGRRTPGCRRENRAGSRLHRVCRTEPFSLHSVKRSGRERMTVRTAIIGVGQTPYHFQTPELTWAELAQTAVRSALEHARLAVDEVEAVVLGLAPSALVGVNEAEKWAASSVGAAGKPYFRVNTGGATGGSAAQAGFYHVASGLFRIVPVVCADKVAESPDAQHVLNAPWDPLYEKDFTLNAINMCSFQAVRHMHKYGTTERQLAAVAVRSRANGARNPYAHLRKPVSIEEALASRYICYP